MRNKFAFIEFSNNQSDLPYRKMPGIFIDSPENEAKEYIKLNNPFIMETVDLAGEKGYRIKLPVTETDALQDRLFVSHVFNKTVTALAEYEVDIILPPKNLPVPENSRVPVANGSLLFPFFLLKCIKHALKKIRGDKDISRAEVLICGFVPKLTECVADCISDECNYITINLQDKHMPQEEDLFDLLEYIYFDKGVRLSVTENNVEIFESADVIINLNMDGNYMESYFKKDAIYVDFSNNERRFDDIIRRKSKISAFNGVRLKLGDSIMPLPMFELCFFVKNKEYRKLVFNNCYDVETAANIKKAVEKLGVKIASLYGSGKAEFRNRVL